MRNRRRGPCWRVDAFEERVRAACERHRSLLIFDQFEEIVTLFDEAGARDAQRPARSSSTRRCASHRQRPTRCRRSSGDRSSATPKLVRAARKGLEFDPQSGEPVLWAEPEPLTVTWHQHAAAYAAITWPTPAAWPHSPCSGPPPSAAHSLAAFDPIRRV